MCFFKTQTDDSPMFWFSILINEYFSPKSSKNKKIMKLLFLKLFFITILVHPLVLIMQNEKASGAILIKKQTLLRKLILQIYFSNQVKINFSKEK